MLGRFRSIGFAGTIVALLVTLAILFFVDRTSGDLRAAQGPWLRGLFVATAVCAFAGALVISRFPVSASARAAARAAPRITWRKEYSLYYWLSFLDGSRMQIYFAFAPFVLVEQFGVDALTLTLLLVVSAVINWQTGGLVGKLVDRYGEKRMLTVGYSMHLLVFLGFALSQNIWLLYLTYLGYNFLFLFSIGTTTYLRKISRPEDLAPSLAMGVSLAHLTAVVVPIVGAALWQRLGYQFPFLFGTVFIFISLWLTQKIDIPKQRIAGAPLPPELRHEAEEEIDADAPALPSIVDRWSVRWRHLRWRVRIPRGSRTRFGRSFGMRRRAECPGRPLRNGNQGGDRSHRAGAPPETLHRSCEAEGWTATAVAAHVALSQDFLIDRVRRIVEDEEFPPFDAAAFHGGNARAAEMNAGLVRAGYCLAAQPWSASIAFVRGLSDDDLDRSRAIPVMGDNPTTAEQFIERVLIGHAEAHLQSLRQCLSNPDPVPG